MSKYLWNIIVVLVIVILVVFIQYKFFPNTIAETTIKTTVDTVFVKEIVRVYPKINPPDTVEVPVIHDYDTTKCDSLYRDLYAKYGTKLTYSDTIYYDSVVTVSLNEIVSKNTIFNREVEVTKNIPIITKTVTITNTKYVNSLYVGGLISSKEIIPSLMYSTKSYTILAGYNLTSKTPIVGVGINLNKIIKW